MIFSGFFGRTLSAVVHYQTDCDGYVLRIKVVIVCSTFIFQTP